MDLAVECHRLAKLMPGSEEYRMASQLLRAASSVPANIAEGWIRGTRKDYANFVSIARGSLAEVETFLLLAERAGLIAAGENQAGLEVADRLGRQLNVLRSRLAKPQPPKPNP